MIRKVTTFLFLSIFISSCFNEEINPGANRTVIGMKPEYAQFNEAYYFSTEPRFIEELGNLVLFRQYILVAEEFQGIHVIDNSDPTNPLPVAFWHLPGVSSFAISGDILFLPLGRKLMAIDISDINMISILSVTDNIFNSFTGNDFPSNYSGSFQCAQIDSGAVVRWVEAELFSPDCWR
jgi:hypothetical protein